MKKHSTQSRPVERQGREIFQSSPERISFLLEIRDRHAGRASSCQRFRLLDALLSLENLTTYEAMRFLDIFDPRPRKLERVRQGYSIVTSRCIAETESGQRHLIGVYSLLKTATPAQLQLFKPGKLE